MTDVFIKNKRGYIALLSVMVISAIGLAIMVSVIATGVNASKTDFALQQSGSARALSSSCVEEALQLILETSTTSSFGNLSLTSGNCSYQIFLSGSDIIIQSTGNVSTLTSKMRVVIATTSPSIVLSSWSEVSDF